MTLSPQWIADCGMILKKAEAGHEEQIGDFEDGALAHEAADAHNATYGAGITPQHVAELVNWAASLSEKILLSLPASLVPVVNAARAEAHGEEGA